VYRQDQCWGGAQHQGGMQRPSNPKPLKEIMNLTTAVDKLAFSPDGQILVGVY